MPRYYKQHPRGYDLDRELPFCEIDGRRVQMGTAGSIIMVCEVCGEQHFREHVSQYESCFKGHGQMQPLTFDLADKLRPMLQAQGVKFTPVAERKAERLEDEQRRPWSWIFGDKTEADFQNGYVKEG